MFVALLVVHNCMTTHVQVQAYENSAMIILTLTPPPYAYHHHVLVVTGQNQPQHMLTNRAHPPDMNTYNQVDR